MRIALTGRRLAVHTDARQRFERGIDPALVLSGLEAATRLILSLCGGEASDVTSAGSLPEWQREAWLRFERLESLGGAQIESDEAVRILEHLGFAVKERDDARACFAVPSWRNDVAMGVTLDQAPHLDPDQARNAAASVHAIEAENDLIEEVLRIHGLDSIPPQALPQKTAIAGPALTPGQKRLGELRRLCAMRGLVETVGFSFVSHEDALLFGGAPEGCVC